MQKMGKVDMELLKSGGRYLAGRMRMGMIVDADRRSVCLEVLTDKDWQGCPDTKNNTSSRSSTWNGQVLATGSSAQAGVPALSSAETELTEAIAGETVKEIIMWTDSWMCRSILSRIGLGRVKHLEALHLYLHEKTRSGELSVK